MASQRNPNEQISGSLIDRLMRRQKTPSGTGPTVEHSKSTGSPLMFETLEPRLLLAADLIAGYAFNETSGTSAADASGHNIVATLVNGPTHPTGQYGNAVGLDGINDYVNLGNPSALQITGSMTVSAWINSSSFPADDAAIVSKRGSNELGFQLDTTVDTGPRTIGFKLTNSSGGQMFRYGATTLQPNTWYYVTGVYNATTQTMDVYLNGQLDNGQLQGTVTTSQQNSTSNVTIGRRSGVTNFEFAGRIDDVRIYSRALTLAEIQADMATPLTAGVPTPDTTAPTVALTAPAANAAVAGTVTVSATASDNIGVVGVQFLLDGTTLGVEDTASPYSTSWNTTAASNGSHTLSARARDAAGNITTSSIALTVDNQAPTGTVVINSGAAATNSTTVTLALSANDALSGVTQMRFSNNGTSFSAAEAYAPTKTWTLSSGAGTKTVYVQFRDGAGNWSSAVTDTIVLDTTAPTTSAIAATSIASNSVTITWTTNEPATSKVDYGLTTSYGSSTTLDSNLVTSHSVVLTGLAANTTYNYRVRSIDAAGNERVSGNSTFRTAVGPDITAPSAPTGLTATPISSTQINLSWTASTDNVGVTGYRVFRDAVQIATTTTTNYSSTGLTPSTSYAYTVKAFDAAGNVSASSATANATTQAPPDTIAPSVPTGLTATAVSSSQIDLAWTASTDNVGVTGYQVFRNAVQIATTTATSYSNTGLTPSTLYTYTVKAFDAAGNVSGSSVAANATTQAPSNDTTPPQVFIDSPIAGSQVTNIVTITADAIDNVGVAGVQFFVDGTATGSEDTTDPYAFTWDTRTVNNGAHTLTALARDANGNTKLSAPITVNVANANNFQNEILATGFDLPTAIKFLPDGRMLVVELQGTIKVLPPPYTQADPTPFLHLTNVGSAGVQQGIYDIALDPNFATNHFYYIFYTAGTPNHDRLSRFTANASLTGTVAGSELILYEDPQNANAEHHGGSVNFGNDGKIYFTTGEHFDADLAQDLNNPRGKIHRINPDGTIPTDNPFYDGAGPHWDSIWALGLRNPFRAYYDAPTGRLIIGDVGGNVYSTAIEEVDIGARGANYGWPNVEAPNGNPAYTAPAYFYPHNGRDSAITGGFVYHGTQFPSSYQGSYFFADYTQNWIRRLTFDANGNVTGVFNFEPADGSVDGPYGDIVYLTEGPDGALYYVDLGYSDISAEFGVSKIRRISYVTSDIPPVVAANATPSQGPAPLTVNFSSAGSSDPEGQPLSYLWTFGDGATSTAANPSHTYAAAGPYQARLTVSDGTNSTLSLPLAISVGNKPVIVNLTPADGGFFRAGDVISFSAAATDAEDGTVPASGFTWNIDFLHEGHVHPGTPITGVTSGSFTIPTSGHDFSGFTRYRITLTVTDSDGLQSSLATTVFPEKVNLTFDAAPAGLTLYLDGIAHTAPFVYDTLVGFNHTIEARNQAIAANTYTFASWSDGGSQQHTIVVPGTAQSYTATYNVTATPVPLAYVQGNAATPQTNQSQVSVTYTSAQVAGDTNIIAIGWNNATSNITSVTDSAGNVYELAVPTARGAGLSQAIYYAKNIKAAAAGTNTVTVTFNTATEFVDLRITEYSGLDPVAPFVVGTSASGSSASASSGAVTTTVAKTLIFGAGMTTGGFSAAGANFTNRMITTPDLDIVEDRFVTTTGAYSAVAPLGGSASWVMQVVAFRAANQA